MPGQQRFPISAYCLNYMYEQNFFEKELPGMFGEIEEARALYEQVQSLYAGKQLEKLNEAQLEDSVVRPLLELLGWAPLYQEPRQYHAKIERPDWTLFASETSRTAHLQMPSEQRRGIFDGIVSFCESKAADKALDTGKAARRDNPYRQVLEYLTYARIPFGFLTNGREWWLVDNRAISSEKKFLRVLLESILADDAFDAFRLFAHLFSRATYVTETEEAPPFQRIAQAEERVRLAVEADLRHVVYGTDGRDSLFERIGQELFAATDRDTSQANLRRVFENCLYLVFRLLFIAYFEDRYGEKLQRHPYYTQSLRKLHERIDKSESSYAGWNDLQILFTTLDGGNANLGIPLLNGGLFAPERATLLSRPRVMHNAALASVLDALFHFRTAADQEALLRRDFRSLNSTHLGTIYEGLLEFEFRIAEEDLSYMTYTVKEKSKVKVCDGFFDSYDAAGIEETALEILDRREVARGSFYLVSRQNSRKASGSYYTPSSLSLPLVRRAIDHQLPRIRSVLDLRILDNSCGSGHLLIEALNYLTLRALQRLEDDPLLAVRIREEQERICKAQQELSRISGAPVLEADETDIVKRLLLKSTIYGVDMQPFAVELAHLALWIDSFVFGTPLSFIEHHVKVGNSLIGTDKRGFDSFLTEGGSFGLFTIDLNEKFSSLHGVCKQLNSIQDTTQADIEHSKELYNKEIAPLLREMNLYLDVVNLRDMLRAEGQVKEAASLSKVDIVAELDGVRGNELRARIEEYRAKYGFFNWEVEFPEAFFGGERGFHIIVGNPPWDKTKFEDPAFFAQYRSRYRTLPESQKKRIAKDLLMSDGIREEYNAQKAWARSVNEYYKASYPLNAGAGDGNLFRFFVERNLGLLASNGTLNYVLPTALLTDDGSKILRKEIFKKYSLRYFDGFENRKRIFPDVDTRYKFGLLQIENTKFKTEQSDVRFMLTDVDSLAGADGVFKYTFDDICKTSPLHMALLEVQHGRRDLDVLRRVYSAFPCLNTNWIDFRNELHATSDKEIFLEDHRSGLIPLYKGDMIWQYQCQFGKAECWLNPETLDDHLRGKEISRLVDDVFPQLAVTGKAGKEKAVLAALGLRERDDLGAFVRPDRQFPRLAFRDVARDTDERTLIAALLPSDIGAQNTLWMSIPKRYVFDAINRKIKVQSTPLHRLLFAQAVFNSLPVDWILRFSVAIHVNKTYLMRIPLPQPSDEELLENNIYNELCRNSLLLSLSYCRDHFVDLQREYIVLDEEIPETVKQKDMLRIRNDVLVGRLYGLSNEEFSHVISGFRVLARKRPSYVKALQNAYCI